MLVIISASKKPFRTMLCDERTGIYNHISPQPGSSRGFPVSLYQKSAPRTLEEGERSGSFHVFLLVLAAATDSSVRFSKHIQFPPHQHSFLLGDSVLSSLEPFSGLVSFNNSNIFPLFSRGNRYFLKVLHPPFTFYFLQYLVWNY